MRRVVAYISAALLLLGLADVATAVTIPPRPSLAQQVETAHFVTHYTPSVTTTAEWTGKVATAAERVYAIEIGRWNYPQPFSGSDDKTDIYLTDCGSGDYRYGASWFRYDSKGRAVGWICLAPDARLSVIAHEFLHLIHYRLSGDKAPSLREATANWVQRTIEEEFGWRSDDFEWRPSEQLVSDELGQLSALAPISLDCHTQSCWKRSVPYLQWPFFLYLTDRLGTGVVPKIFREIGSGSGELRAIDRVLRKRGRSLGEVFADFTLARARKRLDHPALTDLAVTPDRRLELAANSLPNQKLSLAHLASKQIEFTNANGSCAGQRKTLVVKANLSGASSSTLRLVFVKGDGSIVRPTRTDTGVKLSVPVDDCDTRSGTLLVTNVSSRYDGQSATISLRSS